MSRYENHNSRGSQPMNIGRSDMGTQNGKNPEKQMKLAVIMMSIVLAAIIIGGVIVFAVIKSDRQKIKELSQKNQALYSNEQNDGADGKVRDDSFNASDIVTESGGSSAGEETRDSAESSTVDNITTGKTSTGSIAVPTGNGAITGNNPAVSAGNATTRVVNTTASAVHTNKPYTKTEVIRYYNDAVNKVISSKAGYTKSRTTSITNLEGADSIMKIQIVADAVNDFIGVGTTEYKNAKGEARHLSRAALKESDVKSFSCTEANGVYTITLELNDGASSAPNGSDTSPLQRAGLFVGNTDKSEFDYKNANNIYVSINNAEDASVADVKLKTSSAKIIVTVNAATGQITSYRCSWHWDAELKEVKYTILRLNGKGHADTTVSINNFKW